ncbi:MAG: hypothetical protein J6X47_09595 [Clostridia bacterium]|nr:hypothetical protein [Clostridia bacterium]
MSGTGRRFGVQFYATVEFKAIGILSPTWTATEGYSVVYSLFKWNHDYMTTIDGKVVADAVIEDFADNSVVMMTFDPLPAGEYLLIAEYDSVASTINAGVYYMPSVYVHQRSYIDDEVWEDASICCELVYVHNPNVYHGPLSNADGSPRETEEPTGEPAVTEVPEETLEPTATPEETQSGEPAETEAPPATEEPTTPAQETAAPTDAPTEAPTATPTEAPTDTPTPEPTEEPTPAPDYSGGYRQENEHTRIRLYEGEGPQPMNGTGRRFGVQFYATVAFESVGILTPTWTASSGYTASYYLYKWNHDYNTTIAGTPITGQNFEDFPDNTVLTMTFDPLPAGEYLLIAEYDCKTPTTNAGVYYMTNPYFYQRSYLDNQVWEGVAICCEVVYIHNPNVYHGPISDPGI